MAKTCVCVNCGSRHEAETGKKSAHKLGKDKKNLFATRGREEFSALVAKVEEKKQKILKRAGTDNALMVQFTHSDDNKLKSIIVRAKSDIGLRHNTKAAPTSLKLSDEETLDKKNSTEKLKQGKLKLHRCHNYYIASTVIFTLLLLTFIKLLWNLGGAREKILTETSSTLAWLA